MDFTGFNSLTDCAAIWLVSELPAFAGVDGAGAMTGWRGLYVAGRTVATDFWQLRGGRQAAVRWARRPG